MGNLRLQCECANEILLVEKFDSDEEIFFMYYYLNPIKYNLWRRLKFLFTGYLTAGEIILSYDKAKLLAEYIKINTQPYVKKEK